MCSHGLRYRYNLSNSFRRRGIESLKIGDISINGLQQFKYMGETVSNKGGNRSAITERVHNSNRAFKGPEEQVSIARRNAEGLQSPHEIGRHYRK